MKINAGMRVAFWHAGEGTIYEATLTDGKWECVAGLPTLHTHATYTNDNGKKRSIYLASEIGRAHV